MPDTKKTGSKPEPAELPIGGQAPPSPPVDLPDEAPPLDPAAQEDIKPPKGAYVEDLTNLQAAQVGVASPSAEPRLRPFSDEFVGVGGRYIIDAETGKRKEVFEKYLNADGEAAIRKAY